MYGTTQHMYMHGCVGGVSTVWMIHHHIIVGQRAEFMLRCTTVEDRPQQQAAVYRLEYLVLSNTHHTGAYRRYPTCCVLPTMTPTRGVHHTPTHTRPGPLFAGDAKPVCML